ESEGRRRGGPGELSRTGARLRSLRPDPGLGNARLEQLPNERGGQRLVGTEVKSALGLAVTLDVARERLQRHSAEGVVRAARRGRLEARDDLPAIAERRHAVADALLDLGDEGVDRLAKLLE